MHAQLPPPPTVKRRYITEPSLPLILVSIGFCALLLIIDIIMVIWVLKSGSNERPPIEALVVWLVLQAAVCLGAGVGLALRRRPWRYALLVAVLAAGTLSLVADVAGNQASHSDPACAAGGCDIGNGMGATLVFVAGVPTFALFTLMGQGAATLLVRPRRREQTRLERRTS